LHEDPVATGAYVYEPLPDGALPRFAAPIVHGFDDAGLPVQDLSDPDFDLGSPPEARAVQTIGRGSVVMGARAESVYFAGWPLSVYFALRAAAAVVTVESPGTRPWDERIAIHRVAVTTALSRLE
jgi:hypothetical protein